MAVLSTRDVTFNGCYAVNDYQHKQSRTPCECMNIAVFVLRPIIGTFYSN